MIGPEAQSENPGFLANPFFCSPQSTETTQSSVQSMRNERKLKRDHGDVNRCFTPHQFPPPEGEIQHHLQSHGNESPSSRKSMALQLQNTPAFLLLQNKLGVKGLSKLRCSLKGSTLLHFGTGSKDVKIQFPTSWPNHQEILKIIADNMQPVKNISHHSNVFHPLFSFIWSFFSINMWYLQIVHVVTALTKACGSIWQVTQQFRRLCRYQRTYVDTVRCEQDAEELQLCPLVANILYCAESFQKEPLILLSFTSGAKQHHPKTQKFLAWNWSVFSYHTSSPFLVLSY